MTTIANKFAAAALTVLVSTTLLLGAVGPATTLGSTVPFHTTHAIA